MINPATLTRGERLEVVRHRDGLTQRDAAWLHGIGARRYMELERGDRDDTPEVDAPVSELTDGEACRIARRRAGLTRQDVEQLSGFKAKWIYRAETGQVREGSIGPLVRFWQQWNVDDMEILK